MNGDLLKNLNKEQKAAAEHGEGSLLIVAGAGTGKTTVIARRIAYLIESGKAKPEEILAVTFTDKAAGEMEDRVDSLLPFSYLNVDILTFHAFCEKILKEHGLEIGLSTDFKLLNQTDGWLLVRENLDKFNLDYYRPLGNPTKFIHALVKHFGRAKDEEVWPEDYLKHVSELKLDKDFPPEIGDAKAELKRLQEVANAYHVYQRLLLENNCLDFGDLINYALRLFKTRPKILEWHRRKYKYILVDEFQDTNWAQYELVKLLAAPKNNLIVVADDDQSIYKFRGASVSNVLEFKRDFSDAKEIVLVQNYRSPQNLLDLTYEFIQLNNPNRLEYRLARENETGIKSKISKRLKASRSKPAVIEYLPFKTEKDEAAGVAEKILKLKKKEKADWNDFAILVRANNQADVFLRELLNRGVPCQFLASRGLYRKPLVMDILAYLRLLDNYHESASLYRLLNSPAFNFKREELADLTRLSRQKSWSLYETLKKKSQSAETSAEFREKTENLFSLFEKHAEAAEKKTVAAAVYYFLEDTGYLRRLAAAENQRDGLETISYLNQFFKIIERFEREAPDKSLRAFIKKIDLTAESGDEGGLETDAEAGPEAVKIMTVHGAKGLEFPYVFIVNLVALRFPATERREPIELPAALIKETIPEGDVHLEEERRLFYVACTRAKKGLFFTAAEDYGGQRKKKPSVFLREIGMLKCEGAKAAKTGAVKSENRKKSKEKSAAVEIVSSAAGVRGDEGESDIRHIPSEFSYSQIKAYETCPWQYRFSHILKIPAKGKASFSFGKTMHAVLQKFFHLALERSRKSQGDLFDSSKGRINSAEAAPLPSLEEFLEIYEKSWVDDWYEGKERQKEYKEKGAKIIKEFREICEKERPNVKYLEQDFTLKIKDGEEIFPLKGKIDRIDELPDGSLEIIDYKTGKTPKNEKDVDKTQLLIYKLAAEEILKKPVSRLTYYYLESNEKVSFSASEKDLLKARQEIIALIRGIKSSEFLADPSEFKCKYCDFKEICDFREL